MAFPQLAGTKRVAQRITPQAAMENLRIMEQLQRWLHTNVQEALALEVGLLKLQSVAPTRLGARHAQPMKSRTATWRNAHSDELLPRIFAGLFGAFLGLCLLKFGNPPITEKWVTAPDEGLGVPAGVPVADCLGVLAAGSGRGGRNSRGAVEVGCALVASRAAAGLAGLAVHRRHAVGRSRPDQRSL